VLIYKQPSTHEPYYWYYQTEETYCLPTDTTIIRLHRMHETQTIFTDVCCVCPLVCPSVCHMAQLCVCVCVCDAFTQPLPNYYRLVINLVNQIPTLDLVTLAIKKLLTHSNLIMILFNFLSHRSTSEWTAWSPKLQVKRCTVFIMKDFFCKHQ